MVNHSVLESREMMAVFGLMNNKYVLNLFFSEFYDDLFWFLAIAHIYLINFNLLLIVVWACCWYTFYMFIKLIFYTGVSRTVPSSVYRTISALYWNKNWFIAKYKCIFSIYVSGIY